MSARNPQPGGRRGGTLFGRAIVQAILEEIALRLERIGVIGGTHIDASHLVGVPPPGLSRLQVRLNGVDLCAVSTLEFSGPGWSVVCDPATSRAIVAFAAGGTAPSTVFERGSGEIVVGRTGGEDVMTRLA